MQLVVRLEELLVGGGLVGLPQGEVEVLGDDDVGDAPLQRTRELCIARHALQAHARRPGGAQHHAGDESAPHRGRALPGAAVHLFTCTQAR